MRTHRITKKTYMITLGILLNTPFLSVASAADTPLEGIHEIEQDMNIDISAGYFQGLHTPNTGDRITVKSGHSPNIYITVSGHEGSSAVHGLEARGDGRIDLTGARSVTLEGAYDSGLHALWGGEIVVGDKLTVDSGNSYGDPDTNAIGVIGGKVKVGNDANLIATGNTVQTQAGEITIGDNAKIVGQNRTAVYALDNSTIKIGHDAYLDGLSQTVSAVGYYSPNGGSVEIGDRATIISHKNSAVLSYQDSTIKIGDDADITGVSFGVQSNYSSQVEIGKNAVIKTDSNGVGAYNKSEMTLGENTKIHAVNYGVISNQESVVTVGENSLINVSDGAGVWINGGATANLKDAVEVNAETNGLTASSADSQIDAGKNIRIISENGNGLESSTGANIAMDEGAFIQVKGNDVAAILVYQGGTANLNGATIQVEQNDSYALFATDADSKITGIGTYNIVGNVYAEADGAVDLQMDPNSYLKGQLITNTNGRIDFGMEDSRWDFTGSSSVNNLVMNNSVVDMTQDGNSFSSLTIDNLSGGGGTFILDIDGTAVDQSDRIYVNDTFTGTQALDLQEVNGRENDSTLGRDALGTVLASVNDNQGTFTAVDGAGTLYYRRYVLDQKESSTPGFTTDWYLKYMENVSPREKPTPSVKGIISAGSSSYHMWRDSDQLMKRLGDLRHYGDKEKGLWVRFKGSKVGRDDSFKFRNNYMHYEIGYDQVIGQTDNYIRYGGASFSYLDGNTDYQNGKGSNHGGTLSFYGTQMGNKGHYFDLIFKATRMNTDFSVRDYDHRGEKVSGDYSNVSVAISAEYGRKMDLNKKGWYIEPQIQLTLGNFGSANYTANNGVRVRQESIDSALGRIGFHFGKDIDQTTNIYLRANLFHEFGGHYAVSMQDRDGNRLRFTKDFQDTWFEYGVGIARKTGKDSHIYFDVERSAGSDYKKSWQWNAGARWTFN